MIRSRCPILAATALTLAALAVNAGPAQGAPAERPAPAPTARPNPDPPTPSGKTVAIPLFKEGITLFDGGYYHKAIVKFKRAFFHFPSPKIHTRIALSYKWLRNNLKAIEHYEAYLVATKPKTPEAAAKLSPADKKLRDAVSKTLEDLLKTISQLKLTLTQPATAVLRLNGRTRGKGRVSRTFRFNPGLVVVSVTAKDHKTFRQELKLVAGQTVSLSVKLDRIKPDNRGGGAAADQL